MAHQIRVAFVQDGGVPITKVSMWSVPRVDDIVKIAGELDTLLGAPKMSSYRVTHIEHEVDPQIEAHRVNVHVRPIG